MSLKLVLSILLVCIVTMEGKSQVTKVKRKGVEIISIKNGPAPNNYSLSQLRGKWQEVNRVNYKGSAVGFEDTLCYYFTGKDEVFSRDGINMSLRGNAALEPGNILIAAADVFTIRTLNNQTMILDDGEKYIHTFAKKKSFWYENLPTSAVVPETFTTPISTDNSSINGTWVVFRRDAKPGNIDAGTALIRSLVNKANGEGEVTYYLRDKSVTEPCTISFSGVKIKITGASHSWVLNVYKATPGELVFGDESIMYFFKPA